MEQQLFSLKEASEILSVSKTWLDKKIREGKIPYILMGGKRMLTVDHIEWIKENGVRP